MRAGRLARGGIAAAAIGVAVAVAGCTSSGSPVPIATAASTAAAAPSSMPTPTAPGATGTTLAWLVAGDNAPTPARVIVVGDAAGHEKRRITLPDTPLAMYASSVAPSVLVRCSDSWLVVNIAEGTTKTLDLGAHPNLWEPLYAGRRYWALGEPADSGNVVVIDSTTGSATTALNARTGSPVGSAHDITAAPNEDFLETNPETSSSWLIPTADPASARAPGDSSSSPVRFSANGDQVVYTTAIGGTTQVVVQPTGGGAARNVATLKGDADVAFTADPSKLLVVSRGGIGLVDAGTGATQQLASDPKLPMFSLVQSPDRARALVVKLDKDLSAHVFLVDAAAGSVKEITDLAGMLPATSTDRSVLLQTPPSAKTKRYALFDWSTGEVRPLEGISVTSGPIRSVPVAGGGHLITSGSAAWLVSADGAVRALDDGVHLVAAVSPDGTRVVTSSLQGQAYRQQIHDTRSSTSAAIGAGYGTVFVAP
jgi:hypothetical protein